MFLLLFIGNSFTQTHCKLILHQRDFPLLEISSCEIYINGLIDALTLELNGVLLYLFFKLLPYIYKQTIELCSCIVFIQSKKANKNTKERKKENLTVI